MTIYIVCDTQIINLITPLLSVEINEQWRSYLFSTRKEKGVMHYYLFLYIFSSCWYATVNETIFNLAKE